MKQSPALSGLFILTLAACAPASPAPEEGTLPTNQEMGKEQPAMEKEQPVMEEETPPAMEEPASGEEEDPAAMEPVPGKRTVEIATDNWSFTPAAITAKKGEMVEVRLVGVGGNHGFAVPGLGINVPVNAGESVAVEIPTAEAGTYEFFCSIPCGSGHKDMRGTITIQE